MDKAAYKTLEKRIGRLHLRQRLGIESDYERKIFGQGINFFHIENWYSLHSILCNGLSLIGLRKRGQNNALKIQVRHNYVRIKHLPSSFDGYTILQISDLHLDMLDKFPYALIKIVENIEYNICVLTGDFRANTFGAFDNTLDYLKLVRDHLPDPVYGILGNHDSIRMVPKMESIGIHMLLNEMQELKSGNGKIYLAGIDDPHYFRADNIEKAAEHIPSHAVSILLSHSPEIYKKAAHSDFNLMLSGHTHGGQICFPGGKAITYNANCPRFVCAGAWKYHKMKGYTSVGAGVSVLDVRFNCPPEVTLHHLCR